MDSESKADKGSAFVAVISALGGLLSGLAAVWALFTAKPDTLALIVPVETLRQVVLNADEKSQRSESAAATAPSPAVTPGAPENLPTTTAVAVVSGGGIDKAGAATVGMTIAGEIIAGGASNFYRFENPSKLRDIVLVRLENRSATLKPEMKLYNADRSQMVDKYDGTPGASVQQPISLDPGQAFYVEVTPYGSSGAYKLSAIPQKAYDSNEPNDNQLTPTALPVGRAIEGGIMDEQDSDWFRVTGAQTGKVNVVLENLSATLKPDLKLYSFAKSQIMEKYDGTPGASLDFSVNVDAGKDFYVQVLSYGSVGKYKLSTKAMQ